MQRFNPMLGFTIEVHDDNSVSLIARSFGDEICLVPTTEELEEIVAILREALHSINWEEQ